MSIYLDANILFSAGNADSNLHRFLIWLSQREELVTSQYALSEAERNIQLKRPNWQKTFYKIIACVKFVHDVALSIDAGLPDKDKPILGAALAAKCSYLVTGDKRDFGHLFGSTLHGVTILTPLALAEIMLNKHKD